MVLVFLSILLLEWYRIQISKNNRWTCFFLSIWIVIYRLHGWQQNEELNISWNDEYIRLAVTLDG